MVVQMVENYYFLGQKDKARELGLKLADGLLDSSRFYLEFYDYAPSSFESCHRTLLYLADVFEQYGDKDLSDKVLDSLELLVRVATGRLDSEEAAQADTTKAVE